MIPHTSIEEKDQVIDLIWKLSWKMCTTGLRRKRRLGEMSCASRVKAQGLRISGLFLVNHAEGREQDYRI